MGLRIYGITYGDKKTEFTEYKNTATEKLWRFEYNPMIDIVDNHISDLSDDDYLGIFSWKFTQKTGINKSKLERIFNNAPKLPLEILNLSPVLGFDIAGCGNFMNWSAKGHGETLRYLIQKCCHHVGIKYENNPSVIVYANQFIAPVPVYRWYMRDIIKPSLELLEGELWNYANQPANYSAGVKLAELKKHTGLSFYNYIPFVLERMVMQYIHHRQIKTVQMI